MRRLQALPQHGLHGTLTVPGDKSISHRGLMIGGLSEGITKIHHFLPSEDCLSTLKAMEAMGVHVTQSSATELIIKGVGLTGLQAPKHVLDMGNSGTSTRLLMGILAGKPFSTTLAGDASLSKRPMKRVSASLAQLGAVIDTTSDGKSDTLPVTIHGRQLHAVRLPMQVASAQVKSALIFAALSAQGESTIIERLPTRDHTERMLRLFGADVTTEDDYRTIHVQGRPHLTGQELTVPGDMSSAAFFLTAGTLTPNSDLTLKNVGINPTRTGLLTLLQQMGGKVTVLKHEQPGEPVADLRVQTATLHGINITAEDIPAVIDELPLIALLAAHATGTTVVSGAEELRVKETDRITAIVSELTKMGAQIEELPDGFVINGHSEWTPKTLQLTSYDDHRMGMMLAIAALQQTETFTLQHADCVNISYPTFFQDLARLVGEGETVK